MATRYENENLKGITIIDHGHYANIGVMDQDEQASPNHPSVRSLLPHEMTTLATALVAIASMDQGAKQIWLRAMGWEATDF